MERSAECRVKTIDSQSISCFQNMPFFARENIFHEAFAAPLLVQLRLQTQQPRGSLSTCACCDCWAQCGEPCIKLPWAFACLSRISRETCHKITQPTGCFAAFPAQEVKTLRRLSLSTREWGLQICKGTNMPPGSFG